MNVVSGGIDSTMNMLLPAVDGNNVAAKADVKAMVVDVLSVQSPAKAGAKRNDIPALEEPATKEAGSSLAEIKEKVSVLLRPVSATVLQARVSRLKEAADTKAAAEEESELLLKTAIKSEADATQALALALLGMGNQSVPNKIGLATEAFNNLYGKALEIHKMLGVKSTAKDGAATASASLSSAALRAQSGAITNGSAKMILLVGQFIQLIGKNADSSLKNNLTLFQSMQEDRQQHMVKLAADYDAKVKEAEETQKTVSTVSKVVGSIMLIIGTVITVASLGTASSIGIALGVAGLALALADTVVGLVTGQTLSERALTPVMEAMMKALAPLVKQLSELIINALKKAGVDEAVAEKVGSIAAVICAALVAVAAVVAVAVVGKAAVSKLAEATGELLASMCSKLIPEVIKDSGREVLNSMGSTSAKLFRSLGLKSDATASKVAVKRLEHLNAGLNATQSGVQAGGGVKVGLCQTQAGKNMGDLVLDATAIRQISEYIKSCVEKLSDTHGLAQDTVKLISALDQDTRHAGLAVLDGMRASRA